MQTEPTVPTPEAHPAVDPREFRRVMGTFLSGVTVVTALRDGAVHGMTASAFLSVSLDPPLVLVSVGNRQAMHGVIRTAGRFAISMLAADQGAVSDHFGGRPVEGWQPPLRADGDGVPVLDGALATVQCVLHDAVEAGDHTLFVGRVVALASRDGGEPLAYWRGRYRQIAP